MAAVGQPEPVAQPKPEVVEQPKAVEPPKAVEQPKAKPVLVSPLSGFNDRLKGVQSASQAAQRAKAIGESTEVRVDDNTEDKINAAREQIVKYVAELKPRFELHFRNMVVEGNRIKLQLSSSEQEQELRRSELELLGRIVELSGVDGLIVFDVTIEELPETKRPVKLKDRAAHFAQLNEVIPEFVKRLGLQVEG